jgi:hypothetical protein
MLGSETNQQEMTRYRGFSVVAYILQQVCFILFIVVIFILVTSSNFNFPYFIQAPPSCFDTEVLSVLSELLAIPHLPNALKEDIISHLFVDFRLWVSSSYFLYNLL